MNAQFSLALLLSGFFLFLSPASSQTELWPPYNPDSNADGVIGTDDLLELLGWFGEAYDSDEFWVSEDSTLVVVDSGAKNLFTCHNHCENVMPGRWRVANTSDIGFVMSQIGTSSNHSAWVSDDRFWNGVYVQGSDLGLRVPVVEFGSSSDGIGFSYQAISNLKCYCAVSAARNIEYDYCTAGSHQLIEPCLSDKLANGWKPLAGWPSNFDRQATGYQVTYQTQVVAGFWRWAE